MEDNFPTLTEFAELYGLAVNDPKTASLYNAEFEAEVDYRSHLSIARLEGHKEGVAEGRAEGEAIGEARGRKEGFAEGEAIGEARLIEKLRKLGVDDSIISQLDTAGAAL